MLKGIKRVFQRATPIGTTVKATSLNPKDPSSTMVFTAVVPSPPFDSNTYHGGIEGQSERTVVSRLIANDLRRQHRALSTLKQSLDGAYPAELDIIDRVPMLRVSAPPPESFQAQMLKLASHVSEPELDADNVVEAEVAPTFWQRMRFTNPY